MFDKEKFANVLNNIVSNYENISDFANNSKVGRSYISKYINKRMDAPPSPKVLKKISESSKGLVTYSELMEICGHTENTLFYTSMVNTNITAIPLFVSNKGELLVETDLWIERKFLDPIKKYFAFKTDNDSMLPLLGIGDIAIIEKTDTFKHGQTCLFAIDSKDIMIRKIMVFQDYIELHTAFPYSPPIKLTKEEMKERNFTILGRVIKVENQSAFK